MNTIYLKLDLILDTMYNHACSLSDKILQQ